MKENVVLSKSYLFAVRIVNLYKYLTEQKKEFVLSKQLLRSGTAIGALLKEAEHAQSKADFLHKVNISLKEANETEYWLKLLTDTHYLTKEEYENIQADCSQICKMLISIVKTLKAIDK